MGWRLKPKYPEVPVGTLPTFFKPLAAFDGVIWLRELYAYLTALSVLAGALAFFALMTENMRFESKLGRPVHWWVLLVILFVPILVGRATWSSLLKIYRRRLEKDDQRAVGPVAPGSLYVGVSFCEGVWKIGNHQSWSKGFLCFEDEGIVFDAWTGGFMLPFNMIRDVRVCSARTFPPSNPRLFVKWQHPSRRTNTLSFENLRADDPVATLDSINRRISDSLPGNEFPGFDERALPLESSSIQFPDSPAHFQSFALERAPALALFILAIIPMVTLENYLARFADQHLIRLAFFMSLMITMQLLFDRLIFRFARRRRASPANPSWGA